MPSEAVRTRAARAALPAAGAARRRRLQRRPRRPAVLGLARGDWDLLSPRACRTACTRSAARPCSRAPSSSPAAPASWGRSAPPSRAPGRPCSSGASTSRPGAVAGALAQEVEGWAHADARPLRAAGRLRRGALSELGDRARGRPPARAGARAVPPPARCSRPPGRGGGRGSSAPARPTRRRRSRRG